MIELQFGPLHKARFVRRPNRFLLNCVLEGEEDEVEVHLADPGRLKELLLPGNLVWLRRNDNPRRRTQWSAVLTRDPETEQLVSLQSTLANTLIEKALRTGDLEELQPWQFVRSEYQYGSSRWDFLLRDPSGKQLLLEVKSVTLVKDKRALFPDAVTARGRRHVLELAELQQASEFETAVMFVVQRSDAQAFGPDWDVDPAFSEALVQASEAGVRVFARSCRITPDKILLAQSLPVRLHEE
ncbi:MAG: DNA/RNA nuclease SfsA [Firmicutes bacterium]|nr:DNA/RNA nuclease SfsA [Bacillota bacterium]